MSHLLHIYAILLFTDFVFDSKCFFYCFTLVVCFFFLAILSSLILLLIVLIITIIIINNKQLNLKNIQIIVVLFSCVFFFLIA